MPRRSPRDPLPPRRHAQADRQRRIRNRPAANNTPHSRPERRVVTEWRRKFLCNGSAGRRTKGGLQDQARALDEKPAAAHCDDEILEGILAELAKAAWVLRDGLSITVKNGVVDLSSVILDESV